MGRHSDGLTNYKFSTHVYVVIACLVVAVIIIVFWVKAIHGDSTTDKSKCLAGDLTVKIASSAGAESLATNVIDQYNAKKPVVRDHCITAEATKSLAEARADIKSVWGRFVAPSRASSPTGKTPLVGECDLICRAPSLGCLSLPAIGSACHHKSRNHRGFHQQLVSDFSSLLSEP